MQVYAYDLWEVGRRLFGSEQRRRGDVNLFFGGSHRGQAPFRRLGFYASIKASARVCALKARRISAQRNALGTQSEQPNPPLRAAVARPKGPALRQNLRLHGDALIHSLRAI